MGHVVRGGEAKNRENKTDKKDRRAEWGRGPERYVR